MRFVLFLIRLFHVYSVSSPDMFFFPLFFHSRFILSIRAGTRKSAINRETPKLMMTTAAKSCRLRRIFSSKKKIMTSAPIVVKVAANMDRIAFRLCRFRICSVMTIVLSITRLSEIVTPANE